MLAKKQKSWGFASAIVNRVVDSKLNHRELGNPIAVALGSNEIAQRILECSVCTLCLPMGLRMERGGQTRGCAPVLEESLEHATGEVLSPKGKPKETKYLVLKEVCCALGVYMRSGRCQLHAFGELVNNYQKGVMPEGVGGKWVMKSIVITSHFLSGIWIGCKGPAGA